MKSSTDIQTPLSAEIQLLVLLMGDFIHATQQGKIQDAMNLLPHIGAIIDHVGLPPILRYLIANQCTRNMN